MSTISLYFLGTPRIELDGKPVELDTRKAIALLAYLVVTGEVQRRDSLAALLWPEFDHSHALGALRRTLSSIRKGLGTNFLEINRETVSISPESVYWSDHQEFHRLLAESNTSNPSPHKMSDAYLVSLSMAAKLYRGHFMAGFGLRDSAAFDDWQFFQAEMLRREFSEVLEWLVQAHSLRGDINTAKKYAQRWLSMDPLHEPAHRQLMKLYAWADQRNAALRQYQECMRILERELGVPPLEETTELYKAIKENRFPPHPTGDPALETDDYNSVAKDRKEEPISAPGSKGINRYPFVGRTTESSLLQEDYLRVGPDGHFTVIEGEAGIGKTRLAEEFIENVRAKGAVILTAHCYQGETSLAYSPFAELLRNAVEQSNSPERLSKVPDQWISEAARLVPELSQQAGVFSQASSTENPGAQTRFFEGVIQVLLSVCKNHIPGVIFIDDLHWADEASIDLLNYLVRRLNGRPVYLLVTWRGEEIHQEHRLRRLTYEALRAGNTLLLALKPLTLDSIGELVRSVLAGDSAPFDTLSERLYHETDGIPFFVIEYLKAVSNDTANGLYKDWGMPGSVRDLLRSRLSLLTQTVWQIIQTAAVMGRSFDFEILKKASGRSEEETIASLEDLIQRGLVREIQTAEYPLWERLRKPEYDFTHQKIRDLVYKETSLARRRILHRRVAESLVSQARDGREAESLAGIIAQHFRVANQTDEAAEYSIIAGEYARSLYANTEALAHFRAALELGSPHLAMLHEAIGDLLTLSGDYAEAHTAYKISGSLYEGDSSAVARVEHKLGKVHGRHGEWDLAEEHFLKALECLGENRPTGETARIYADCSLSAHHRGKTNQAFDLARRAMLIAGEVGDRPALAQAHNILGILARNQEDFDLARTSLEQSLILAETLNDPGARVAALNNLALVYGSEGNIEKAVELAQMALKLCSVQGDRHREAALQNNLADLYYLKGQSEIAMTHLKQAVAIFSEIDASVSSSQDGTKVNHYQPEIWKLSEW